LSGQEQQDVARVIRGRNLRQCLDGSDTCDSTLLTAAEQQEVSVATRSRKLPD
jgi:hypothetical protein